MMAYLDMLVAIRRMGNYIGKAEMGDPRYLALRKDAQVKASRFIAYSRPLIKTYFLFSPSETLQLQHSGLRHHGGKAPEKKRLGKMDYIAKYIQNQDWNKVQEALVHTHKVLEDVAIQERKNQIQAHFKKEAEANLGKNNYKEKMEAIKNVKGEFNLDQRYQAFIDKKKPSEKIHKVKALFYPEHLNVGANVKEPVSLELPLYYYQKNGYWHLVSLVHQKPGDTFTAPTSTKVKLGEDHPPYEMFASLDRDTHLPKGILYYEIPGGDSKKVHITSHIPWWRYAGYVALALFLIGLVLATGGAGTAVAGVTASQAASGAFFLAGAVGATGAVCNIAEESYQGKLTVKSFLVNMLDIAGAFIGALKLFRGAASIRAANAAQKGTKASVWCKIGLGSLNARYRYILLEKLDLGVDATMVVIGTVDGIAQIASVVSGPGTWEQKTKDILTILPLLVMQGGIFLGTVKGRVKTINDAQKGKILGAVSKKASSGGGGAKGSKGKQTTNSSIKVDAQKTPALAELRAKGPFSKETIDEVLALIRRPEDFEAVAKAIANMNQPQLKGLMARFSEKDVLYTLYYFGGDFYQAHRHLFKHKGMFGDKGIDVYLKVRDYEFLKEKMQDLDRSKFAEKYKQQVKRFEAEIKVAKKKQSAELEARNKKHEELEALRIQQKSDQQKLETTGQQIRVKQKALAKQEVQEEKFSKLTKDQKFIDEKGVESWRQNQQNRLAYQQKEMDRLVKLEEKQAKEVRSLQEQFETQQLTEQAQFFKKMGKVEHEQRQILKQNKNNQAALEKLAKMDEEIEAFVKKQEQATQAFEVKQKARQEKLKATRQDLDRQQAKLEQHQRLSKQYNKAAKVIKEGVALRKQINKLQNQRDQLLLKVQATEQQIQQLRLQLNQIGGQNATLARQIRELTATKNEQQAQVVQKEMEIARAEEQLAKIAKEENAHTLEITKAIKTQDLTSEKISAMLDKNVAPKDIAQLELFIGVQQRKVQSFTDRGIQTGKSLKIEKDNLEQLKAEKLSLEGQKIALEKRIQELSTQSSNLTRTKPKRGRGKPRRKKGLRMSSTNTELQEVKAQLQPLDTNIKNAQTKVEQLEAAQKTYQAKATQERAKLEVYQEFLTLQQRLAKTKLNLQKSEQAYTQFQQKLKQNERELRRIDAQIKASESPRQRVLDDEVERVTLLYNTANKRYQYHDQRQHRYKKQFKTAQQHHNIIIKQQQKEKAAAVAAAERAEKMVNIFKVLGQSYQNIRRKSSSTMNPPVFKAWWKVSRILLKIFDPRKKELDVQMKYAIQQGDALGRALANHLTDKNIGTLPNDEAALWNLLYKLLEESGSSHYSSGEYARLLKDLKEVQKHNAQLIVIRKEIKVLEQALQQLPPVQWPKGQISPGEEGLLNWMDEQEEKKNEANPDQSSESNQLTPQQIKELQIYLKKIEEEQKNAQNGSKK